MEVLKSSEAIPKVMLNRPLLTEAIAIEHEQFHEPQDLCLPYKCPFCFEEDRQRKKNKEIETKRVEDETRTSARESTGWKMDVKVSFNGRQIYIGAFRGIDVDIVRALAYDYLGVAYNRHDRFRHGIPKQYEREVTRLKPIVEETLKKREASIEP